MKIQTPKYNWQTYDYGSISLCMIMKNEEKLLARCLASVAGLVDEIIIVDTGSTDRSVAIAQERGATVLSDPWQDDFARPRNISIEHATKEYILIMDPDEILLHKDHATIRALTTDRSTQAWRLTTKNYCRPSTDTQYRQMRGETDPTGKYAGYVPSTKTRFFKNGLGIHFWGCYHELVDWYIKTNKIPVQPCPVPIHHWTHEHTPAQLKEKGLFYLRLGEKKVKQWPSNGQAWWELAVAESIQGLRGRAAKSMSEAFRRGFGWHDQYFVLSRVLRMIAQPDRASYAFEKGICGLFPNLTHIEPEKKKLEPLIQGL